MKNKFVLFAIYSALIEIRLKAYENNDDKTVELCNLLHSIPLVLINAKTDNDAYNVLIEKINFMGMQSWLNNRNIEFLERYPQYKDCIIKDED